MATKVFIKRELPVYHRNDLLSLIQQMRHLASKHTGYIYGETLKNDQNSDECVVVSTWQSMEYWNAWFESRIRNLLQEKIDVLNKNKTEYRIYQHLENS